jgi:hypothetical protein
MVDPALIGQRVQRIQDAVALKKPDRVPVLPVGDAWTANAAGVRLSEFANDPFVATRVMLEGTCPWATENVKAMYQAARA